MSALKRPAVRCDPDPVRDYIAAMADELAQLARSVGDARLAMVLDLAASLAELNETAA